MIRLSYPEIGEEEIQAVVEVLRSGFLVQGTHVAEFEQRAATYLGVRNAVAVSSGTAALHLALLALGIGPGDEVIVPDFTFPATANVVEMVGARAVLVDIDLTTFNVNVEVIRQAITINTRTIIPVHLFGLSADMEPILDIAKKHSLLVIEDAACALGAVYNGRKCGSLGDLGCFSFHPRKAITTGEGGLVVTDNVELAERLRQLRNHGMQLVDGSYHIEHAGLNYRMTDFQGALGTVQFDRLEGIIRRRAELARLYTQALVNAPGITCPREIAGSRHVWQSYVVLLDEIFPRNRFIQKMRERGIETTIGTYAVSAQDYYRPRGLNLPCSLQAYRQSLSLPLHTRMDEQDVETVVNNLLDLTHLLAGA